MFGDKRINAEKDKYAICGTSKTRPSGFQRKPKWRATCALCTYIVHCAVTLPPTGVTFVTIGFLASPQILAPSVKRFLRYRSAVCTCCVQECAFVTAEYTAIHASVIVCLILTPSAQSLQSSSNGNICVTICRDILSTLARAFGKRFWPAQS